jgi:hypothetical protein
MLLARDLTAEKLQKLLDQSYPGKQRLLLMEEMNIVRANESDDDRKILELSMQKDLIRK